MKTRSLLPLSFLLLSTTHSAQAGFCDYRPSELVGSTMAAGTAASAAAVSATGAGANAIGVYTLVNATTGATMVAGTWAGASAAGTAGIIAGTSGAIGTVVSVLTAPATIVAGAVVAVGVGGFEGACYFADTRITEYKKVDAIVKNIALTAPKDLYMYDGGPADAEEARIVIRDPNSEEIRYDTYMVKNIYIVNGTLMHRDWLRNTVIGFIGSIENRAVSAESVKQ